MEMAPPTFSGVCLQLEGHVVLAWYLTGDNQSLFFSAVEGESMCTAFPKPVMRCHTGGLQQ